MKGLLKTPSIHNSKESLHLRKLFDKIENQIINWEALGVRK